MRPVFPDRALRMQAVKRRGFVGLAARPQDHLMRAGNRVDAIDLHETDAVDQRGQIGALAGAGRRFGQRVSIEKQRAGIGIGKVRKRGHGDMLAGGLRLASVMFSF